MIEHERRNLCLDRLYLIRDPRNTAGLFTGKLANGEQVLMGILNEDLLLALFFAPAGGYERHEFFPVACFPDARLNLGQQNVQRAKALEEAKQVWMTGLGMRPGDIRVRHFAFPEWHIGIAEWPLSEFNEVAALAAAGKPLESEFQIEWQQKGRWVLHWNNEFWMSAVGDVEAT